MISILRLLHAIYFENLPSARRSIQSFFACQMESVQQINRQIRMTIIKK